MDTLLTIPLNKLRWLGGQGIGIGEDGSQWVFKFVMIACNIASPPGSEKTRSSRSSAAPRSPRSRPAFGSNKTLRE